jgi:hypothetical protein
MGRSTSGRLIAAFGLALLFDAAPPAAVAQPPGDAVDRAAGCAIHGDRRRSAALSQAIPGSEGESATLTAMTPLIARCFARNGLADTPEARALFAGRVAERLYVGTTSFFQSRETSRTVVPARTVTVPQAIWNRTAGWPSEAALAECTAAVAQNEVDRLLRTRAGSPAEAEAMAPILAAVPACLDQGQQLVMGRRRLRAELARAFYRYINGIVGPLMPRASN